MNVNGKNILVLGMGETGVSMAKWLTRQNAQVRVADSRSNPPNMAVLHNLHPSPDFCGVFSDQVFEDVELIAMSPGISMMEPHVQRAIERDVPVVGDMTLFRWALEQIDLPSPEPVIIAITGTNGKTTVTAMAGAMLQKAGFDVEIAGNIGPAVLDAFMRRLDEGVLPQIWVLEVSSFQLELTQCLNAEAATVLNISGDHLDRYADMQDYTDAKARIFKHDQFGEGIQILNRDDVGSMALALTEKKQITFGLSEPENNVDFGVASHGEDVWLVEGKERLMKASELKVNGTHNMANALAALALCRAMRISVNPLIVALREFSGLPHRMQKVSVIDGIVFIDDSKSTNAAATVAALNGLQQKSVLIAGGDGKGQNFSALRDAVAAHARAVVLIGRDAKELAEIMSECGITVSFAKTMQEAVQKSFVLAQPGDAVLLSPACASFDMFRNYIHRAEAFIEAVSILETRLLNYMQKKH